MDPKCYAVKCIVNGKTPKTATPLGISSPPEEDKATVIGNMHQKFRKDRASGSGDMLVDRQTDTQMCSLQYFATAPTGKVMNTSCT